MTRYRVSVQAAIGLMLWSACGADLPDGAPGAPGGEIAARARLAASGRFGVHGAVTRRARGGQGLAAADPCAGVPWSDALDLPSDRVLASELVGAAQAAQVRKNLGVITPLRGDCFVLLSTGVADHGLPGARNPEPGTDLPPEGTAEGDQVAIHLKLRVPQGANLLSLQYNFLSAESPDFTGSRFNDTFSVQITDPSGVRAVEVASVNSSDFFDVSESRARGTGFDLFTDDPAGVDEDDFTGGKPDAGLTDFHVFSAPVEAGTELDLTLKIQDNGDGLLDSAVLIDALEFSALQAVDPNPALVVQAGAAAGTVARRTDDLVNLGTPIRGAVADGVTEVLLRMKVPREGHAAFSIADANDGALRELSAAEVATSLPDVALVSASDRQLYAVAVYRAPASFDRTADDHALVERTTQVRARFTGDDGSTFDAAVELQIRRPPVVVVRGIWTQPDDWLPDPRFAVRELLDDPRFVLNAPVFSVSREQGVYSCDPQTPVFPLGTDCKRTDGVVPETCTTISASVVAFAVQGALDNTRRLGIAATQADVVAHGTSGLRVRRYIANGYIDGSGNLQAYQNAGNLMQGDIRRLITINTPHLGMAMADMAILARDHATGPALSACTMRQSLSSIEPGDIDLATRDAIALPATPVPSHAIYGTGGAALTADFKNRIGPKLLAFHQRAIVSIAAAIKKVSSDLYVQAFGSRDHDLMSDVASQRGCIAPRATSRIPMTDESQIKPDENSPDSDYFRVMRSPRVNLRVQELLTSRLEDGLFATFPATSKDHPCDTTTGQPRDPRAIVPVPPAPATRAAGDAAPGLRIVSPAEGREVLAGDRIRVQVASDGGFVPVTVMTSVGGAIERSDLAPFDTELQIPPGVVGPLRVTAIAFDAHDDVAFADDVTLNVRTTAAVQAVRILTQNLFLYAAGDQRQLSVLADYDDGFTRNVTSAAADTVYLTSNPEVVTVSNRGVITAVRSGIATVIAQNGGAQDSITVTVKANASPVVKAGADVSLACNLPGASVPVQLDGSPSFDPDGDDLTFTWFEGGVELATGPAPLVALGVGVHTLDLVVFDGLVSGRDSVTVAVLADSEPPQVTVRGDNPRSIECAASYSDDGATAADACDGDLSSAIATASHVDTRVVGGYTVDYEVRDRAGLVGAASRSVLVADRTPPQLSILGDSPAVAECGGTYRDGGAVAFDLCDGDVTGAIVARSGVNTAAVGRYAVVYQVADRAGQAASASRAVEVVDRTPPQIAVTGPSPAVAECGLPYADPGATAVDACDGDLTAALSSVSQVDVRVPSNYTVAYEVHDRAGLTARASRAVVVTDRTPPQLAVRGANPAVHECGTAYHDAGATAADLCAGDLTSAIRTSSTVNPGLPGTYVVRYQVQDPTGQNAAALRTVRVVDRTPPGLTIAPLRQLSSPDDGYRAFDLSDCAAAVDACGGPLDVDRAGTIVAIHSDEPDARGPGDPRRDIVIVSSSRFLLRNQARGAGNGRVYEIEFAVRDPSGNTTGPRSCFIGVRPRRYTGPLIDDGRVVTVRPRP